MDNLKPNSFASYDLTAKEELQGRVLTSLQQQVLCNHRATIAEEMLSLEFDPDHPQLFVREQAFKRGQLDFLSYVLEDSLAANSLLNDPNYKETP